MVASSKLLEARTKAVENREAGEGKEKAQRKLVSEGLCSSQPTFVPPRHGRSPASKLRPFSEGPLEGCMCYICRVRCLNKPILLELLLAN